MNCSLADELGDCSWDSDDSCDDGTATTDTVVDTTEEDEEASFRLKDLATVVAEQQALLLRQTEILHALAAMYPGGASLIKDPVPVLKPAFSTEEDEVDELEDVEEEDEEEHEVNDTCESPGLEKAIVSVASKPATPTKRPVTPKRRRTSDFRVATSPSSKAFLLAHDDILDSLNVQELALKIHNLYYDSSLGEFIGSGIPNASLYEKWTRTRGTEFGNQLLDLLIRTARSDGNSEHEYDEDLSKDCQIFGITGNLVVTKGWISEISLFNSLRDDAQDEDYNLRNPSSLRDQRILQVYNLTPKIAASLCSKGHFLDSQGNFDFLSSYINFQNSFRADFSNPESGFFVEYHFAYLSLRSKELMNESTFPNIDSRGLRRNGCFPPDETSAVLYESRRSFSVNVQHVHNRRLFKAIELCEDYFVRSPGLLRKQKSDSRRISRWPRIQSLSSAPTFLRWLEQSFEVICVEWNLILQKLEQKVKNSDVLFNSNRLDFLFEDPYERSKTYVWALRTLSVFERIIHETLQTWESFQRSEAWRRRREAFWFEVVKEPYMSEERYRRLREESNAAFHAVEESIASNVRGLELLRTRISRNISEIILIRDGLFHGPAVQEIKVSFQQNDNNIRFTALAAAFFPLTLATSFFGASGIPESFTSTQYLYTLSFFCLFIFSLHFGGLSVVIRTPLYPFKNRLRQQMKYSGLEWRETASGFEQQERFTQSEGGPSAWRYVWYFLTHPRRALLAVSGLAATRT